MRRTPIAIALLMAACAAPAGPNAAAPSAERDCFNVQLVRGYSRVDDDTIRLRASASAEYDVDLAGARCVGVEWARRIAVEAVTSPWICVGEGYEQYLYFEDPTSPRDRVRCDVVDVRRAPQAPAAGS